MKRVCIFCGSSRGKGKTYTEMTKKLGEILVLNNIELVYGGGGVGLMGDIAHSVIDKGGNVIGVIPKALFEKEVAFETLPDLRIVNSMHERKSLMVELSDGFIALPGGLGTIEEFFEVLTWTQLGIHNKPCGILNINGYFDYLIKFFDLAIEQKFVNEVHKSLFLVDTDPNELIKKMRAFTPPTLDKAKWILSMNNT